MEKKTNGFAVMNKKRSLKAQLGKVPKDSPEYAAIKAQIESMVKNRTRAKAQ